MPGKQRGHNEGSIYQRTRKLKNGTEKVEWVASVNLGYGPDGKRKRKVIYGETRREVAEALKVALRDQQQGLPIKVDRQTVAQFLNHWLSEIVKPGVRPKTYASYKQLCDLYIIPALGRGQVSQLTPQQILTFINSVAQTRVKRTGQLMSARTVGYCYSILHNSLNEAVRLGVIVRNPAHMVDPPTRKRGEARYLPPEQAKAFLEATSTDRLSCLYVLAITLGMRQGELLGLTWDNVDLDKRQITVTKTLQRVEGQLQFAETKTVRSRRVVPLSNAAVSALRAHRDRQQFERRDMGAKWVDHNLVFPNTEGKPYDAGNMVREFHKALERADIPQINFHSLRHTCASLLLTQGVHMRVVMELLGHSQVSMTMDLYSHVVPELKRDAANGMDVFLYTEPGSEAV